MLRPNPVMRLVGEAPFDGEDVAANSRAQLSQRQRRSLERERLGVLTLWMGMLAGWIVLSEAFRLRPWMAIVGAGGALGALLLSALRYHDDLHAPVMAVQNVAWVQPLPFARWRLQVGDQQFDLPRRWRRVLTSGSLYRVYYSAGRRVLLSAEYQPVTHTPRLNRHVTGRLR